MATATKKQSTNDHKGSTFVSRVRLNLRGKLILAFMLIALVPMITLIGVVIFQTQNELTALLTTNLNDQTARISESVGGSLDQLTKDLSGLAVNPSVEQMVVIRPTNIVREKGLEDKTTSEMEAIMDETRNLETNTRTQEFLQATVGDSHSFSEVIVVNLDGMVVGATARPDRFMHLDEPWFQEVLEHEAYISDVQQLPGKDEPGLVIATVINRTSTGRPAGVIRGLVPLGYFTDRLIPIIDGIDHGELQLLINGKVVSRIINESSGPRLSVFLTQQAPTAIALGQEGSFGQDSTGRESITASSGLKIRDADQDTGFGWEFRIAQPTTYALALTQRLTTVGVVGAVLTALAVAIVALLLANSMAGPIKGLTEHAKAVSQGHLRQFRTKQRRDETGALTQAFNGMTSQLARLLHRIRTASGELALSSQEISAGMEEMAAGTQNQLQDIQSGTDQIEEMNQAMLEIDRRAGDALELSRNATGEASKGQEQVRAAVEGMENIKTSVDSLGSLAEEIGKILGFIRDIAEQTNLLALNAAIEAARAGEQGRSFAVVAQEVGDLAARSQSATADIDQVLRRIRGETVRSVTSVEDGQKQVYEVQKALEVILQATKNTEILIQEIARESVDQTGRTKEAVALFQSIGLVTEQTAAGTEETAASAQNLAELAQQLQSIITSFQQE
ncbi:MAG TPA: methyl-accepting chemotaxis protein [Limnochordia bacterium]|nr:methyl-accepting chemotaxis protein [Limnochordia bacterium]